MLRQTQSSIIFTQQLGRGLRKASGKDSVVVIDFIGNYANNYLIPIALYGNTGDRDVARKNLQRETIGISSISFDKIARERVLASLDTADLSNMQLLSRQYQQMRYELGHIPMLMDIARRDASLVYTMAAKNDDYLSFVRSREKSLSRGRHVTASYLGQLEPTSEVHNGMLKMLTATQLRGLRPHELLILAVLCGLDWNAIDPECSERSSTAFHSAKALDSLGIADLQKLLPELFLAPIIANCSGGPHWQRLTTHISLPRTASVLGRLRSLPSTMASVADSLMHLLNNWIIRHSTCSLRTPSKPVCVTH